MKVYAVVCASAENWPDATVPVITMDRAKAAMTWHDLIVSDVTDEEESDVKAAMRGFIDDMTIEDIEWTIGSHGPVDEMTTVSLKTVEVT